MDQPTIKEKRSLTDEEYDILLLKGAIASLEGEDTAYAFTAVCAGVVAEILEYTNNSDIDLDRINAHREAYDSMLDYAKVASALLFAHWKANSRCMRLDIRGIVEQILYGDCSTLPAGIGDGEWPGEKDVDYPSSYIEYANRIISSLCDPPEACANVPAISTNDLGISSDFLEESSLIDTTHAVLMESVALLLVHRSVPDVVAMLRDLRVVKLVATAGVLAEYHLIEHWRGVGGFDDDIGPIAETVASAMLNTATEDDAIKRVAADILDRAEDYENADDD